MDSDNYEMMCDEESDFSEEDFFADENAAPTAKSGKAAPKSRPSNEETSVLASSTNAKKQAASKKTIEEMYQKKTQLEHILLRPDTYSK